MRGAVPQTEKGFMQTVLALAQLSGWSVYHTHDSRRSHAGWPDLVLCRPPRLLIVELKTDTGRVKPKQKQWLAMLQACGLDARLWRPGDWEEIKATLMEDSA